MRVQLARPNQTLLSPEQYNQLFTMHGITMIFLYALPVLSGFQQFLWPLMLGSRDMAFPASECVLLLGISVRRIFSLYSFPLGKAPDAGWFNYVPLPVAGYNPGPNIDVYALGMVLLGISTTVGSINFIVTLFRTARSRHVHQPRPHPRVGDADRFGGQLFAVPAVSLAFFMLWMDRQIRHAFLRCRRWRTAAALATPVLDVRPPVGVCDRSAGNGHRFRCVCRPSADVRW